MRSFIGASFGVLGVLAASAGALALNTGATEALFAGDAAPAVSAPSQSQAPSPAAALPTEAAVPAPAPSWVPLVPQQGAASPTASYPVQPPGQAPAPVSEPAPSASPTTPPAPTVSDDDPESHTTEPQEHEEYEDED